MSAKLLSMVDQLLSERRGLNPALAPNRIAEIERQLLAARPEMERLRKQHSTEGNSKISKRYRDAVGEIDTATTSGAV